jgi:hypothetical protein
VLLSGLLGLFGLLGVLGVLAPPGTVPAMAAPAAADDASTADAMVAGSRGIRGAVLPDNARRGERVTVHLAKWPARTQVQAVVCGDLGIGGSKACHLPGAATGLVREDGTGLVQLTVAAPPRPCPCIVRVRSFGGADLALDLPLNVIGHRRGSPPVVEAPRATIDLVGVEVEGGSPVRSTFGLPGRATVVVTVANRGTAEGAVPPLVYGFGRGDVGAEVAVEPDLVVPGLQERQIRIEVATPAGGGRLQAVARWQDGAGEGASAVWSAEPWGLLVVLVAGLAGGALALALVRRRRAPADLVPDGPPDPRGYPLPDVVYVEQLGGVLVNPALLAHSRLLRRVGGRITPEDLTRLSGGEPERPNGENAAFRRYDL